MTQRIKNQQGIVDLSRYGLNGFAWFGTAEQDPKTSPIKLYDGIGNIGKAELSQPLTVQNGEYKNKNGQTVYPVTEVDEYSVLIANENGTPVYQRGREIADDTGGGSGSSAVYDAVYDNLQQPLAADLSAYDFIFIKAENAGWRGTPTGADINNAYYRTGNTGGPSTGDAGLFYDSVGNEWISAASYVEQELQEEVSVLAGEASQNAVNIAQNTSDIAAINSTIVSSLEWTEVSGTYTKTSNNGLEFSPTLFTIADGTSVEFEAYTLIPDYADTPSRWAFIAYDDGGNEACIDSAINGVSSNDRIFFNGISEGDAVTSSANAAWQQVAHEFDISGDKDMKLASEFSGNGLGVDIQYKVRYRLIAK